MSNSDTPTFGIDLGTTCSAIGWIVDGLPTLIEIEDSTLVPSVVAYSEDGSVLVGRAARNQQVIAPKETLASTKRRLGTGHTYSVAGREITPQQVAADILRYLAASAAEATGVTPKRVVVTVPAWFPQDARTETRAAAEAAGLEVVRLINEPTAAALAHGAEQKGDRLALVYDFGGGTFDASLVDCREGIVEVKASHGDLRLGGDDLDAALLKLLLGRLREEDAGLAEAVTQSAGARQRFLAAVRDAKHELSETLTTRARAPFLVDHDGGPKHLDLPVDRDDLNELFEPLLERTFESVDKVLDDADIDPGAVDEVLLVGGTSLIPRVIASLQSRYGWEGNAAVPPQRAVGLGAAIQAGIIDGGELRSVLLDVAPYPLSVAAISHTDGPSGPRYYRCSVVTPRNAALPGRHAQRFHTTHPTQPRVEIPVLQGGDANPLRNVPLGAIRIDDLPNAPEGTFHRPIAVEFRHDLSGVVSIKVTDELSGQESTARVDVDGAVSDEAREMIRRAIEEDELLPGDPSDPDRWLQHQSATADVEGMDLLDRWSDGDDAQVDAADSTGDDKVATDAKGAFQSILDAQERLTTDYPEHALELRSFATRGMAAIEQDDRPLVTELYDDLSDRMFELGIYL